MPPFAMRLCAIFLPKNNPRVAHRHPAFRQPFAWLAKPNASLGTSTIRDIEQDKDVRLSDLQRVAGVLGLRLELVEQVA